jgi:hypothetical protein
LILTDGSIYATIIAKLKEECYGEVEAQLVRKKRLLDKVRQNIRNVPLEEFEA